MNDVTGYGAIVLDESGSVLEIIEKQRSGRGLLNCGMYAMPKVFFDSYKEIKLNSVGEDKLTDAPKVLAGLRGQVQAEDAGH